MTPPGCLLGIPALYNWGNKCIGHKLHHKYLKSQYRICWSSQLYMMTATSTLIMHEAQVKSRKFVSMDHAWWKWWMRRNAGFAFVNSVMCDITLQRCLCQLIHHIWFCNCNIKMMEGSVPGPAQVWLQRSGWNANCDQTNKSPSPIARSCQ